MDNGDLESVISILNHQQTNYWFIGGRAIDLLLGYKSRPHKDLDILVSITDFEVCRYALLAAGFITLPETDHEKGVFLQKEETLVDLTKVSVDNQQNVHTFGMYKSVT